MYIDYNDYASLYGEISSLDFNRIAWEACRILDNCTTGSDGFRKLKYAFPVDPDDADSVSRCAAKLINILQRIEEAEKSAALANGYTQNENGLKGRVIVSVSSGSESISYATGKQNSTIIDKAATDSAEKNRLLSETIRGFLSDVQDANGVKLMFMGAYPIECRPQFVQAKKQSAT